jgi:CubicO group peptidase (beta-lactamase class C family)
MMSGGWQFNAASTPTNNLREMSMLWMIRFDVVAKCIAAAVISLAATMASGETKDQCESTPEQQGMDASALSRGLRDLDAQTKGLHSLLVARNGCIVLEAYWPTYERDKKHYLNSATKSFLSSLVGIALKDGKLRIDDPILPALPEYPDRGDDPRKRGITIKHLLTMSSGISWPQKATGENASVEMDKSPDWVRYIIDRPMAAEPGAVTNYSNGDSHLLAAALQRITGMTALEFARERLFEPLGIHDVAWDTDPQGRNIGSAALQMRPRDMLRFGLLYLQRGRFGGRQIVDSSWVDSATTAHVKMPTAGGPADYGYYWWLYPEKGLLEAWGGAGQRISLFRDWGIVIVMTADIPNDIPRSVTAAKVFEFVERSIKSSHSIAANPTSVSNLKQVLSEIHGR